MPTKKTIINLHSIWVTMLTMVLFWLVSQKIHAAEVSVPLYGLFETSVINRTPYDNPFTDVELNAAFTSPTGKLVKFFGFYDGDGNGGQTGNVWKQRFMPDELGTWTYALTFSDGSPGTSGSFRCIVNGAKPGPWKQDPSNPRWFKKANGDRFLPVAMHASSSFTPIDWQDAINWCKARGYNTLITATFNKSAWGDGWGNVTAWVTQNASKKEVNYERMNLKMWHEWDDMLKMAGDNGIYIGPFDGPNGRHGGQQAGKYPPSELAFFPEVRDRFDTPQNLRFIRYLVARQACFWNLAYWALTSTELSRYMDDAQIIQYGEYVASITPFGRMITAQDIEQKDANGHWVRCLANMDFSSSRKFNTVQTATHNWHDTNWQNAYPNNNLALEVDSRFPVMTTEGLWEGQERSDKPLRIIWGFFTAAAHTMWADWRYENQTELKYGSIGRGWVPIKPLSEHLFKTNQLGTNCTGDEQLKIATDFFKTIEYWKMSPHNELVTGSTEAYCLAEPGSQYMIYTPNGGTVKLDLTGKAGTFELKWLNPRDGSYLNLNQIEGDAVRTTYAPTSEDWVLFLHKTHDAQAPLAPTNLKIADRN